MIGIPLTQGQVALVDDEDFELVSQYKWCAGWDPTSHSFYAQARAPTQNGKQVTIRMHRLIMNAKPGEQVDHIHHKTLDNRKSELRVCSRNQNQHNSFRHTDNSSGYKGVCLNKKTGRWYAQICVNSRKIHLGHYSDPESAHAAYCAASTKYHGEFGCVA